MSGQFNLLKSRRFLPFFVTQLLGAANDNIFKQALVLLVVFKIGVDNETVWVNLAAGLFVLPFFIFSGVAGKVAQKYNKDSVIRYCKIAEIVAMLIAILGFYAESLPLLFISLFLMGSTSAFFGPAKYSIMPQHLHKEELIGANALVESGTFLAILIGTILGGYLIMLPMGEAITSGVIITLAVVGYVASRSIPVGTAVNSRIKLRGNIVLETKELYSTLKKQRKSVFNSVLAISWFWFIGATFLAQIPVMATFIHADSVAVTLFLATFSIGIGLGSLFCEKLSKGRIELGIVPLGSIGITLSTIAFAIILNDMHGVQAVGLDNSISGLWAEYDYQLLSLLVSLLLIGVFGGFYTVPLYAVIQTRTPSDFLPLVIAGNNMLNAAFMVGSALFGMAMYAIFASNVPAYFYTLAAINIVVAIYIYRTVPEFFLRFCSWIISNLLYRVRYRDMHHIPDNGACIVAPNHVSFMDALIIFGAIHRPVKFVMFEPIYKIPILNAFFRAVGAIPIASKKDNPEVFYAAFDKISTYLEQGEVVCIFPEGKLTSNGEVDKFKQGITHILKRNPVPVVPMAINGLWGSMFSRKNKIRLPRMGWSCLKVSGERAIEPEKFTLEKLEESVKKLHASREGN